MSSSGTESDPIIPVGLDPTRPSVARIYDFLLGGKDHYEIDRRTASELLRQLPHSADLARENRAFVIRAARFLASQTDVIQYLDLGSGLPTAENVHQIVQRINPESKVVYVDHDPVVSVHGRALLEENELTRFINHDVFDPGSILGEELVRAHLDFTQPIALFCTFTLHHYTGDRHRAAEVMREYIDALPSGSYVVISHLLDPENDDSEAVRVLNEVANNSVGGLVIRTEREIRELFHELELIQPNPMTRPVIVELANWWPDGPRLRPLNVCQRIVAGGVGRKR